MGEAVFRRSFLCKDDEHPKDESANSMLKSYVPPGCPMHMFLKHYMCLQFSSDADEGYEEKRNKLAVLWLSATCR